MQRGGVLGNAVAQGLLLLRLAEGPVSGGGIGEPGLGHRLAGLLLGFVGAGAGRGQLPGTGRGLGLGDLPVLVGFRFRLPGLGQQMLQPVDFLADAGRLGHRIAGAGRLLNLRLCLGQRLAILGQLAHRLFQVLIEPACSRPAGSPVPGA